jgi:hypothetical protein
VVSALLVVAVFVAVATVWIQDDPDAPLAERLDLLLLLVLAVTVVAFSVELGPVRLAGAGRRAWLGCSMLVASLVGRRKR